MSYHDEIGNKFNTNALLQSNGTHLSPANHVNASNHLHTLAAIQQQAAMHNRGGSIAGRIEPPKVIQGFVPGRPVSRVSSASMAPNGTLVDEDIINSTIFGLLSSEEKNNLLQYLPEIDALTEGNVKCLFRNSVFRQNITLFQSMLKTGKLTTVPKSFVQNPPPVLSPEPAIYYPMKPLSLEQILRQPRLIRFKHDEEYLSTFEKYIFQDDELDEDFALLLKQHAKDKKLLEKVALEDFGLDQKKKRPRLTLITNSNRKFPLQMPNAENLNHNVNMNNVMTKFNIHDQDGNHFYSKNHNSHLGSGYPNSHNTNHHLTNMHLNMNSVNNAMKKPIINRGSLSKQFDSIQQNHQFMGRDAMNNGNPNNFQQSSMMSNQFHNSNMRQPQDNRLKVRERTAMDSITLHNYVPSHSNSNSSSNLGNQMNHSNQSFQLSQGNSRSNLMGRNAINLVHENASNIHPSLLQNRNPGVGNSGLVRSLSDQQLSNPGMRTGSQQQQDLMSRKLNLMRSAPESLNGSGSSSQMQNYQSNVSKPMQLTDYSNSMLTSRVGGMQSLSIQAKIQQQQQQNQLLQQQAQAKIQQQHQQLMHLHQLQKQQQNQPPSHTDTPLVKSMAMPKSLSFPHLQMNSNSSVQSNSNGSLNSTLSQQPQQQQQQNSALLRAGVKGQYEATSGQSLNGSFRLGANFATSTTLQSSASPLNTQQPQVPKVLKFVPSPSPANSSGTSIMNNNSSNSGNATNLNFIHFQNNTQANHNSLSGKPSNLSASNFIDLSSKFIVNSTSGALSNSTHVQNNPGSSASSSLMHTNNQQKSASDLSMTQQNQPATAQANSRILSAQSHMLPGSFSTSATQHILNQQQQQILNQQQQQTMTLPKSLLTQQQMGTSQSHQSSLQMLQQAGPLQQHQNAQQQSQHSQHNQQYQQQLMLMQQKQQQSQLAQQQQQLAQQQQQQLAQQQQQQLAQQQQQSLQYNRAPMTSQQSSQQSSMHQQAQLMSNQLHQSQASPRTTQQQQMMYQQLQQQQQLQNSANQHSSQQSHHQNSLFSQSMQQNSRPLSQSAIQQPNLNINQQHSNSAIYTNANGAMSQQQTHLSQQQQPNSTQQAYSQHLLQQHQQQQAQMAQYHNQQQSHSQQHNHQGGSHQVQSRPAVAPEQIQQLIQSTRGLQHRYKAYDDDELPLKADFFFYPFFEDKKIEELVFQVLKAEGTAMHAQAILNAILRQMPALANHSCPAQMLAATICNYIKAQPSATPFAKYAPMTFGLKDAQLPQQQQQQEKPTPLANPHFV